VRDHRFTWNDAGLHQNEHRNEFRSYLEEFGDLTPVIQALQAWWRAEGALLIAGGQENSLEAATPRMRGACAGLDSRFRPLLNKLDAAFKHIGQGETPELDAVQRLVGQAIGGALAASTPNLDSFDNTIRLLRNNWPAIEAFMEGFANAIPSDSRMSWVSLLGSLPPDLDLLLEHSYDQRNPTHQQLLELDNQDRSAGLVYYAWTRHHDRYTLRNEWIYRARVLLAIAPDAFALAFESLPLRGFRNDILEWLRFSEDRDAILAMLRNAPDVIQGQSWTGCTGALLALSLVFAHADKLHSAVELATNSLDGALKTQAEKLLPHLESTEIPQWIATALGVALERTDGRELILLATSRLVGANSFLSYYGRQPWSCADIALEVIKSTLTPPVSTMELAAIARFSAPPHQTPRDSADYVVTASILAQDLSETWNWYTRLLADRDKGLCSHVNGSALRWIYSVLGGALLDLPEFVSGWREAWRSLFIPDREHARFTLSDIDALLPSQHLIHVGFGALNRKDLPHRDRSNRRSQLWRELRIAVVVLTQEFGGPLSRIPESFAGTGFEFAPAVFGDSWRQVLVESLDWMATDSMYQLYVAEALVIGGIPRDEALSEMAQHGFDILSIINGLGQRPSRDRRLAAACARLEPSFKAAEFDD
jgi:hypothetical protein